jgi:hypothetical protein
MTFDGGASVDRWGYTNARRMTDWNLAKQAILTGVVLRRLPDATGAAIRLGERACAVVTVETREHRRRKPGGHVVVRQLNLHALVRVLGRTYRLGSVRRKRARELLREALLGCCVSVCWDGNVLK